MYPFLCFKKAPILTPLIELYIIYIFRGFKQGLFCFSSDPNSSKLDFLILQYLGKIVNGFGTKFPTSYLTHPSSVTSFLACLWLIFLNVMKYCNPSELWGTNSLAVRSQYEWNEYCDRKFLYVNKILYLPYFICICVRLNSFLYIRV